MHRHAHDHPRERQRPRSLGKFRSGREFHRITAPIARFSATLPHREARDVHQDQDRALTLVTRVLLVGAGSLITVVGVVFTLQGVGVIGGSFMSGTTTWAVAGPLIALAGLALIVMALRRRGT